MGDLTAVKVVSELLENSEQNGYDPMNTETGALVTDMFTCADDRLEGFTEEQVRQAVVAWKKSITQDTDTPEEPGT